MRMIPITGGTVAFVDDEDYERVAARRWRLIRNGYAQTDVWTGRKYVSTLMHRFILGLEPGDGIEVDHINRSKLDNQKENLRICTRRQNLGNSALRRNNTTGFKGVKRDKRYAMPRFHARGTFNRVQVYLGSFSTAEEAARAYNKWAQETFGQFAYLNPV